MPLSQRLHKRPYRSTPVEMTMWLGEATRLPVISSLSRNRARPESNEAPVLHLGSRGRLHDIFTGVDMKDAGHGSRVAIGWASGHVGHGGPCPYNSLPTRTVCAAHIPRAARSARTGDRE